MDAQEASLLEQERRSLAMVAHDSPSGWSAEKVGKLIREYQSAQRAIVQLERRLHEAERAAEEAVTARRHPAGGRGS